MAVDPARLASLQPDDARELVDARAAPRHLLREGEQIAPRVELRLVFHADGAGHRERERCLGGERRVQAGFPRGRDLGTKLIQLVGRLHVGVGGNALELTVDSLPLGQMDDVLDGFLLGPRVQSRGLRPLRLAQPGIDERVLGA